MSLKIKENKLQAATVQNLRMESQIKSEEMLAVCEKPSRRDC